MAKAKAAPKPEPAADPAVALVPLADLYIHRLNARSEPAAADIEALAESIGAIGLLQNLAGFLDPESHRQAEGAADIAQTIGIVAGGRRLRAIRLLAEREGRDPATTTVPVKITASEDTARLWASAENTARQALHPADEVRAYGRMVAKGVASLAIARAFAVSEAHVARRLRLAQLPAPAIEALRANEITLDQAAALTTARNEAALLEVLDRIRGDDRYNAFNVRHMLAAGTIDGSDHRARFVGLDDYRAAGGEVLEDLFSDTARLLDEALLQRLFDEKLHAACVAECARGWANVRTFSGTYPDHSATSGWARVWPVPVDLPEADADELDELLRLGETNELTDEKLARMDELEARAAGDYADADIAAATLWLYVDRSGDLCTHGPYRPREDRPASGSDQATSRAGDSSALSASLAEDLKRIRLAALQIAVGDDSSLIWDLLAWHLSGEIAPWSRPLALSPTRQQIEPEKDDGFTLPDRVLRPDNAPDNGKADMADFAAFRARSSMDKGAMLDRAIARLITGSGGYLPLLASLCTPDVRRIWTPTASAYFTRLPVPVLDRIWKDLVPADLQPPARFLALKKAEKARELHDLFNSADYREALGLSRDQTAAIDAWLPAELQWPAVDADAIATPPAESTEDDGEAEDNDEDTPEVAA